MFPARRLLLLLLVLLSACSHDDGATAAMAVVDELQAAMRRGDQDRCRELVTDDSAAALPELPWQQLRDKQPLEVQRVRPRHLGFFVTVIDPNAKGQRGEFVVVPEYGQLKVDLVATAGLTAREVVGANATDTLEPRPLTPADHDRIRQMQLAQPQR